MFTLFAVIGLMAVAGIGGFCAILVISAGSVLARDQKRYEAEKHARGSNKK